MVGRGESSSGRAALPLLVAYAKNEKGWTPARMAGVSPGQGNTRRRDLKVTSGKGVVGLTSEVSLRDTQLYYGGGKSKKGLE